MSDSDFTPFVAARWLARVAAADGAISPSERKVLSEFAKAYGLDAGKIIRLAYGMTNEFEQEVVIAHPNEIKGRQFEQFVVSLFADKSRFNLLAWRGDKISGATYAAETLLPDLRLRHRLDVAKVEYLVECKYRSSWGEEGIDLSSQYVRYHFAAKKSGLELFIAIGIGGSPSNPDELFIIPGRMVKLDKKIDRARFIKCLCPKTPEGYHNYINHYYNKHVFKKNKK